MVCECVSESVCVCVRGVVDVLRLLVVLHHVLCRVAPYCVQFWKVRCETSAWVVGTLGQYEARTELQRRLVPVRNEMNAALCEDEGSEAVLPLLTLETRHTRDNSGLDRKT